MKQQLSLILSLCMIYISAFNCHAQQPSRLKDMGLFTTAGLGISNRGLNAYLSLDYIKSKHWLKMRYINASEFQLRLGKGGLYPAENDQEYGLLYGRYWRQRFSRQSLHLGIGVAKGRYRGAFLYREDSMGFIFSDTYTYYENKLYVAPCVPFEATHEFYFKHFALAFKVLGHVSTQRFFIGAGCNISIGKLTPHHHLD